MDCTYPLSVQSLGGLEWVGCQGVSLCVHIRLCSYDYNGQRIVFFSYNERKEDCYVFLLI